MKPLKLFVNCLNWLKTNTLLFCSLCCLTRSTDGPRRCFFLLGGGGIGQLNERSRSLSKDSSNWGTGAVGTFSNPPATSGDPQPGTSTISIVCSLLGSTSFTALAKPAVGFGGTNKSF